MRYERHHDAQEGPALYQTRAFGSAPPAAPLSFTWRSLFAEYRLDWLILAALAALEIGLNVIHPFRRFVNEEMLKGLMLPLKSNSVPSATVPIIALGIPIAVFLVFFFRQREKADLHQAVLGLGYTVLLAAVVVDSLKNGVGRPRPNFFWRCFPDGTPVFAVDGNVLCTGSPSIIREGYKSFPSGHSSWSFSGLGYLSLYLAGKLHLFSDTGHVYKLVPVALPLIGAVVVGVTRLDDYWHFWSDVFVGALIGRLHEQNGDVEEGGRRLPAEEQSNR